MPITTILCDLDGTLIDSRRDIALAFQYALREVVRGALPDEDAIARHIGKPLDHMVCELGYQLPSEQLALFLRTYRTRYAATCTQHTRPYPGVLSTLQELAILACGVVTTKTQAQADAVIQQLRLTSFFQHVQGSVPGLRLKPAPDTVLSALVALQRAPQEALMVGDTAADILAGRAAGVRTCAVTYGFGTREELEACQPDYVLETFAGLMTVLQTETQA